MSIFYPTYLDDFPFYPTYLGILAVDVSASGFADRDFEISKDKFLNVFVKNILISNSKKEYLEPFFKYKQINKMKRKPEFKIQSMKVV